MNLSLSDESSVQWWLDALSNPKYKSGHKGTLSKGSMFCPLGVLADQFVLRRPTRYSWKENLLIVQHNGATAYFNTLPPCIFNRLKDDLGCTKNELQLFLDEMTHVYDNEDCSFGIMRYLIYTWYKHFESKNKLKHKIKKNEG
jgi:hypothetical protein